MLDFSNMSTVTQGSVGLGLAIAHFVGSGSIVSLPLNDNQNYDLIVDLNGLKKVQVKTTKFIRNGLYRCQLKKVRPNRTSSIITNFRSEDVDFLFVVTEQGNKYCIPSSEIKTVCELTLDKRFDKFKI